MATTKRSQFITNYERRLRIEKVMETRGWSWYVLSKAMNREQTSVQRAFKVEDGDNRDVSLKTLIACAIALGVSVGFLVDRTPASLRVNRREGS